MTIPADKRKLFLTGFIITAVVSFLAGYIVGFMTAVLAGAVKELYDEAKEEGTFRMANFGATIAGAIAAVAASVAVSGVWAIVLGT